MARRIAPVAEHHGEVCAINRGIRIDISCRGVALCWVLTRIQGFVQYPPSVHQRSI